MKSAMGAAIALVRGQIALVQADGEQGSVASHGVPNAQGKRHRSTEGAEGTNKGQDNGEALALVGVRLTAQLGATRYTWLASSTL